MNKTFKTMFAILCFFPLKIIFTSDGLDKNKISQQILKNLQQANKITSSIQKFKKLTELANLEERNHYNLSIPISSMQQSINLVSQMYEGSTEIEAGLNLRTTAQHNTYIQHTISDGIVIRSSHFDTSKPKAKLTMVTLYHYDDPNDVKSLLCTQDFHIDTQTPNKNSYTDPLSLYNVSCVTTSRIDGQTIMQIISPDNKTLKWHLDETGSFGFTPTQDQIESTIVSSLDRSVSRIVYQQEKRSLYSFNLNETYFDIQTGEIIHDYQNDNHELQKLRSSLISKIENDINIIINDIQEIITTLQDEAYKITTFDDAKKLAEKIINTQKVSIGQNNKELIINQAAQSWIDSTETIIFTEWVKDILHSLYATEKKDEK